MKYNKILILLGIIFLVLLTLNSIDPMLLWDENAYLGNARSHLGVSNFQEDFRFPMTEYIVAGAWSLTGENIFVAKLIIMFLTLATIFIFYEIAKDYFKNPLIPTALFALCPVLLEWGFRVYADIPSLFFMILSFYIFQKKQIFWAGFASGLAFLSRFPIALFPLAVGLFLTYKKRIKDASILSLGFIVSILPWLLYNFFKYGHPLWDLLEQWNVVSMYAYLQPTSMQVINTFLAMGLLVIFIPLGIWSFYKKPRKDSEIILLYTLFFIVYYYFVVLLKPLRYQLANLPFMYLLAYEGLLWTFTRINKYWKKAITIAIIISVAIGFIGIASYTYKEGLCTKDGAIIQAADFLKPIVDQNTVITSNHWPWFGYLDNVKAFSMYSEDINLLISETQASYIIYFNQGGLPYNKTILDNNFESIKEIKAACNQEITVYKV